jgi:hypothetical protein
MGFDGSRHVLFVVGMHRSGTSALCMALHACGASFGSDLLAPVRQVNDQGFWEPAEVVALNDRLLNLTGAEWYSVTSQQLHKNWRGVEFDSARSEAREILKRGFGAGPLEVVKDPRLCITLPFWLILCQELRLRASVCVMTRSPIEVCRSLKERDGFPTGYGLRLLRTYLTGISNNVPPAALHADYERLLSDPVGLMREFCSKFPLSMRESELIAAVRCELRHQNAGEEEGQPSLRDYEAIDFQELDKKIESLYPIETTMSQLATVLVSRGQELTRIGKAHELALQTIDERDGQIMDFDQRLQEIGNLHTHALQVIEEKDAKLQRMFRKPGIGLILKAMWKYETG